MDVGQRLAVDPLDRLVGLVDRVDERQADLAQAQVLELGEQRVPEGLGGHAGAVGDVEDGPVVVLAD